MSQGNQNTGSTLQHDLLRQRWIVALIVLGLLTLVIGFLYQDTVLYLLDLWVDIEDGQYGHGFLVLAVSLYLIWEKRQVLVGLPISQNFSALFVIAAISLVWMLAFIAGVRVLQGASLVFLLAAVIWMTLGNKAARYLMFPVFILFFAIPIWTPLEPVLQKITATVSFGVIRFIGIPAMLEGYSIELPAGAFEVGTGCSGLRFLLVATCLGSLFAYFTSLDFKRRFIIVIIAGVTAVIVNWLRVLIVLYAGYITDMQHSLVHEHQTIGWIIFGCMIFLLMLVGARYLSNETTHDRSANTNRLSMQLTPVNRANYLVLVGGLLALAVGPVASDWVLRESGAERLIHLDMPVGIGQWEGPLETMDDWHPNYHGVSISLKKDYRRKEETVHLYVGYYQRQQQGKELINALNSIDDGENWALDHEDIVRFKTDQVAVLEGRLRSVWGRRQRLVWYWYQIGGQTTTSASIVKLIELLGMLRSDTDAAVIAVAADYDQDPREARELLGDFMAEIAPSVQIALDSVNDANL